MRHRARSFGLATCLAALSAVPRQADAQQEAQPRLASVSIKPFCPGTRTPYAMDAPRVSLPPRPLLGLIRFAYGFMPYQISVPDGCARPDDAGLRAAAASGDSGLRPLEFGERPTPPPPGWITAITATRSLA